MSKYNHFGEETGSVLSPFWKMELKILLTLTALVVGANGECKINIIAVIDESTSIGLQNFTKVKNFLSDTLRELQNENAKVAMSIIKYYNREATDVTGGFQKNLADLETTIAGIDYPAKEDLTCTGHAMEKAKEIYQDKNKNDYAGAETQVWLITDGGIKCNTGLEKRNKDKARSHRKEMDIWIEVGDYFKEEKVTLVGFGIGKQLTKIGFLTDRFSKIMLGKTSFETKLRKWCSPGKYYAMDDYDELDSLPKRIATEICPPIPTIQPKKRECPDPPEAPKNGGKKCSKPEGEEYFNHCDYFCNLGYCLKGSNKSDCIDFTNWVPKNRKCVEKVCKQQNLIVLVDESKSVKADNFEKIKQFLENVIKYFQKEELETAVSIIQFYNEEPKLLTGFYEGTKLIRGFLKDYPKLLRKIGNMEYTPEPKESFTCTGKAMMAAEAVYNNGANPSMYVNADTTIWLITDGAVKCDLKSTAHIKDETKREKNKAKQHKLDINDLEGAKATLNKAGVKIVGMGVGDKLKELGKLKIFLKENEITEILDVDKTAEQMLQGWTNTYHEVKDWNDLAKMAKKQADSLCECPKGTA